jgi:2-polyprenyl-3-methyl-5-hydroxy-6-metoxy-1,4-benzoquinol methylase
MALRPHDSTFTDGVGESRAAATDSDSVDRINAEFYGDIKYPWAPQSFERVLQPDFWSNMLSQDVGFRSTPIVPRDAAIWVAGCGTNQALITALRFPQARVIGSDLSEQSLEIAQRNARSLGVTNLELRRESINGAAYRDCFDYVICTGVIHHNAHPDVVLATLAASVQPTGILELMVYNRFHRVFPAAFQAAIRTLLGNRTSPALQRELPIAKKLVAALRTSPARSSIADELADLDDAAFADALLQPVEHSYTVESLDAMARNCNLELITFAIDHISRASNRVSWNLELGDRELQEAYDALPDVTRWQVMNLLLNEASPMLWFYLQRADSPIRRPTERDLVDALLAHRFARTHTQKEMYIRNASGDYARSPRQLPFPQPRALGGDAAKLYAELDESRPLQHTIDTLGLSRSFSSLHRLRIALTTSAFPYLAVREPS